MSFVNIGRDGPPNHTLEIEGDMFVSNVEDGSIVPVEILGDLRLRNKPPGVAANEYRVIDMHLDSTLFGITVPSSDASGSITDFCIDGSKNIGIGTTPTKKLDIEGSMYISGTLTNESNVITNSLTVNGTISSTHFEWGANSTIYGFLPSGAILMTTLTAAPSGWTDVTNSLSFTGRNVLLAENETLAMGGNDNVTLTTVINHTHGTLTHNSSHTHSKPILNLSTGGVHTHGHNIGTIQTPQVGDNHRHWYEDIYLDNESRWGVSSNDGYPAVTIMDNNAYINANTNYSGNHTHNVPGKNSSESKYGVDGHSHTIPSLNVNTSTDRGGNHGHTTNSQGSSSSFSIVPPFCELRFFQRN